MAIAPLALPNSVRTALSFKLICAVEDNPSSVLTWDSEIDPDAGSAMAYTVPYAVTLPVTVRLPDESSFALFTPLTEK